ncbi:hypothetical protein HDU67_002582 [Dinochytrium kinnereticum]|nr:hypothetical protein HDU67_002582 [Dinochytrium kinnereticum]
MVKRQFGEEGKAEGKRPKLESAIDESESDYDEGEDQDASPVIPAPSVKRSHAAPYEAPTNSEMLMYKDTTERFHSNFFKLQISELLKETRISRTMTGDIDRLLKKIKGIMDSMEDRDELSLSECKSSLKEEGVYIPFPTPAPKDDVKYKFKFQKPSRVFIFGSYVLNNLLRTPGGANIDMAVEIPDDVFTEKDFINYRYFHKRAYYISVLAAELQKKTRGIENAEFLFDYAQGDIRRPILILKLTGTSWPKAIRGISIRIFPTISQNAFASSRLSPEKSNARLSILQDGESSEVGEFHATPRYNTAMLMDGTFLSHLNFQNFHMKSCPEFQDACALAKIWLEQRGLSQKFSGFIFGMTIAYLLGLPHGKSSFRLDSNLSSFLLFKLTLEFLAKFNFRESGIFMTKAGQPLEEDGFSEASFRRFFDVIIVDPSGKINLAAFLNISDIDQLQLEATSTLSLLQSSRKDSFSYIFLSRISKPLHYYDSVISIDTAVGNFPAYKPSVQLDFPDRNEFARYFIMRVLQRGLKNRVELIGCSHILTEPWKPSKASPTPLTTRLQLTIGFVHREDVSLKAVELGPSASEEKEVMNFRRLWGSKADLRRFDDGTISYSVVWDTDGSIEDRVQLNARMASYLISRHVGIASDSLKLSGGDGIRDLITIPRPLGLKDTPQDAATSFQSIRDRFNTFAKQVKALEDLPISITNVIPLSSGLRSTSVFIPQLKQLRPTDRVPRKLDVLEAVVEFESSNRWPDNLEALTQMKLALALCIAKSFMTTHEGSSASVFNPKVAHELIRDRSPFGHVDVTTAEGHVFRLFLKSERDLNLDSSLTGPRAAAIEGLNIRRPFHSSRMHNLCSKFELLSLTIRLFKRFVSSHLLSTHFSEESLEIIAAKIFTDPSPYPSSPKSPLCGLVRILELFSTWDWRSDPILFEYESGELPDGMIENVMHSHAQRGSGNGWPKPAIAIVTSADLNGGWWTSDVLPSSVEKLQKCCKAALRYLSDEYFESKAGSIAKIFLGSSKAYHMVLRLDPSKLSQYHLNVSYDPTALPKKSEKYRNLSMGLRSELSAFQELNDPVLCYLFDLQKSLSDSASLYYDIYGGDVVGVTWDMDKMKPQNWKVNTSYNASFEDLEEVNEKSKKATVKPNWKAIAAELQRLGNGLVIGVEISSDLDE